MSERMSAAAFNALQTRKPSKYGAMRTHLDGYCFDSQAEANRYAALKQRQLTGEISGLVLQPKYPLKLAADKPIKIRSKGYPQGRASAYIADFRYFDHVRKAVVVEDVKGQDTPSSRLKRAIVEAYYGVTVEIVK